MSEGGGVLANLSHGMADLVSYGNAERDVEQVILFPNSRCVCISFPFEIWREIVFSFSISFSG